MLAEDMVQQVLGGADPAEVVEGILDTVRGAKQYAVDVYRGQDVPGSMKGITGKVSWLKTKREVRRLKKSYPEALKGIRVKRHKVHDPFSGQGPNYYDPFKHQVHVSGEDPSILHHELGHAIDFGERKPGVKKAGYLASRMFIPGGDLYQEYRANRMSKKALKKVYGSKWQSPEVKKFRKGRAKLLGKAFATYAMPTMVGGAIAMHALRAKKLRPEHGLAASMFPQWIVPTLIGRKIVKWRRGKSATAKKK